MYVAFVFLIIALSNAEAFRRVASNRGLVRPGVASRTNDALVGIRYPKKRATGEVLMSSGGRVGGSVLIPEDVKPLSRKYMRLTIFSWWCQIVLSVVSGVILTFAQSVRKSGSSLTGFWSSGFALSTIGVAMAFVNSFWTWTMTRTARRAYLGRIDNQKVVPTFRRYSRISITISLVGMFMSLLGAEQIVGTLASKVLSSQGYVPVVAAGVGQSISQVQALDIFLVQANTNAIFAHFIPLTSFLWSQKSLPPE